MKTTSYTQWINMIKLSNETLNHLENIRQDGYTVIKHTMDSKVVAEMRDAIDRLKHEPGDDSKALDRYRNPFNRDALWLQILDLEKVIELADLILKPNCHVLAQSAWKCPPGFQGSPLHIDYLFGGTRYFPRIPVPTPPLVCFCLIYLNDITSEEMAPTYVVPGSHVHCQWPHSTKGLIPIFAEAGDALFFRPNLWHKGGKTTHYTRYMIQTQYAHNSVSQKTDPHLRGHTLKFNEAMLEKCTSRQIRLLDHYIPGNLLNK